MRYLLLILCGLVVGCNSSTSMEARLDQLEAELVSVDRVFAKSDFRGRSGTCFIASRFEWEAVEWTRTFTDATGAPIAIPEGVTNLRVELCKDSADPCVGSCAIDIYVPAGDRMVRGWGETLLTLEAPTAEWRGLRIREPGVALYIMGLDMGSHLRIAYRIEP